MNTFMHVIASFSIGLALAIPTIRSNDGFLVTNNKIFQTDETRYYIYDGLTDNNIVERCTVSNGRSITEEEFKNVASYIRKSGESSFYYVQDDELKIVKLNDDNQNYGIVCAWDHSAIDYIDFKLYELEDGHYTLKILYSLLEDQQLYKIVPMNYYFEEIIFDNAESQLNVGKGVITYDFEMVGDETRYLIFDIGLGKEGEKGSKIYTYYIDVNPSTKYSDYMPSDEDLLKSFKLKDLNFPLQFDTNYIFLIVLVMFTYVIISKNKGDKYEFFVNGIRKHDSNISVLFKTFNMSYNYTENILTYNGRNYFLTDRKITNENKKRIRGEVRKNINEIISIYYKYSTIEEKKLNKNRFQLRRKPIDNNFYNEIKNSIPLIKSQENISLLESIEFYKDCGGDF